MAHVEKGPCPHFPFPILVVLLGAAGAPPGLAEIAAQHGFDRAAVREVRAGGVATVALDPTSDKELAVAALLFVRAPIERVHAALRDGLTLEVNPDILAHGRLKTGEGDLEAVAFAADESGEVADLLDAEPGGDFNLDRAEIDRIRAVARRFDGRRARRSAEARAAAADLLRGILAERWRAYRRAGLEGIAGYDRDEDDPGEAARPDRELRSAADASQLLARHDPALHRALVGPRPADGGDGTGPAPLDGVDERHLWIKQRVEGRPAFILAHRLARFDPAGSALLERQYYVSHTYNSLQRVTLLVPAPGGTFVSVALRTASDRVDGIGTPVAHRLGHRRLRAAVTEHLCALRAALEEPGVASEAGGG